MSTFIRPMRCKKCRFAIPRAQDKNFECRRHPPTLGIFPQQTPDGRVVNFQTYSAYPAVQAEHWCGEHKPHIEGMN
jgi:hypothetical protein